MMNLSRKIIIFCSLLAFLQAGLPALDAFHALIDGNASPEISSQLASDSQLDQLGCTFDAVNPLFKKYPFALKQRPRAKRASTLLPPVESVPILSIRPLSPLTSDGSSFQSFYPLQKQVQQQLRFTVLLV